MSATQPVHAIPLTSAFNKQASLAAPAASRTTTSQKPCTCNSSVWPSFDDRPLLGLILTGGASSRMGTSKAWLEWPIDQRDSQKGIDSQTKPLCFVLADRLKRVGCNSILLSARQQQIDERQSSGSALPDGVEFVVDQDQLGDIGPARGLLSAHQQFPKKDIFVIACDFPFADCCTFRTLLESWKRNAKSGPSESSRSAITCFQHGADRSPEPLLAIWSIEALQRLEWNVRESGHPDPAYTIKQILGLKTDKPQSKATEKAYDVPISSSVKEENQASQNVQGSEARQHREASTEPRPAISIDFSSLGNYLLLPSDPLWLMNTNTPDEWSRAIELQKHHARDGPKKVRSVLNSGSEEQYDTYQYAKMVNLEDPSKDSTISKEYHPALREHKHEKHHHVSFGPALWIQPSLASSERTSRHDSHLSYMAAQDIIHATAKSMRDTSTSSVTKSSLNEAVPISECVGRICVQDVVAPASLPVFTNSAIDGFAVCSAQTVSASPAHPLTLHVEGRIKAGSKPPECGAAEVNPSRISCWEIMSGAPFPVNRTYRDAKQQLVSEPSMFDACVRIEDVDLIFDSSTVEQSTVQEIRIRRPVKANANRREAGEDIRAGDLIVKAGTVLNNQHLLVLASVGIRQVIVQRRMRIAVMATGDELQELSDPRLPADEYAEFAVGAIPDSNSVYLSAALETFSPLVEVTRMKPIPDQLPELMRAMHTYVQDSKYDMLITSGGMSCGRYDLVPLAWREIGAKTLFHGVDVKPGHPIGMGSYRLPKSTQSTTTALFGLPGNPVAAAVCCRFFVVPFIRTWLGMGEERPARVLLDSDSLKRLHQRHKSVSAARGQHTPVQQPDQFQLAENDQQQQQSTSQQQLQESESEIHGHSRAPTTFVKAILKAVPSRDGGAADQVVAHLLPMHASSMMQPLLRMDSWVVMPPDADEKIQKAADDIVVNAYPAL